MPDIQQGSTVYITNEILDDRKVAFSQGEQVVIERVFPNQQPQYKYLVVSKLGERWQLGDDDLTAIQPHQQTGPPQPPPQAPVPKKSSEVAKGGKKKVVRFLLPHDPTEEDIQALVDMIKRESTK